MSEQDKEKEFIQEFIQGLIEEINCNNRTFEEFYKLMLRLDEGHNCLNHSYPEFRAKIKQHGLDAQKFLVACFKMHEILAPCDCELAHYIKDLVNILWILEKDKKALSELRHTVVISQNNELFELWARNVNGIVCWNKKLEILGLSENYQRILFYVLHHHQLIEHVGDMNYSWISGRGYYIFDLTTYEERV